MVVRRTRFPGLCSAWGSSTRPIGLISAVQCSTCRFAKKPTPQHAHSPSSLLDSSSLLLH